MNIVLLAALALLGKEIVLQPTNVVDVTATGCTAEAMLYVNGFRSASATLLRTRETVQQTDFWGFETLRPGELRLHPQGLVAGDVIKLELNRQKGE